MSTRAHSFYLFGYNASIVFRPAPEHGPDDETTAFHIGKMHGRWTGSEGHAHPKFAEDELLNYMEEQAERQKTFVCHGGYTISNCGGYEVEISSDGEGARLRDCYGSDFPEVTDWLEIETVENEDWNEGEDEDEQFHQVIDPTGYNIPLSLVMCA